MRRTYSAGGVVLDKGGKIIITSQRGKAWSLPKGHMEKGEDALTAAKREIEEETGISDLVFIKELGTYERPKMDSENKDDKEEMKVITIFLFTTNQIKLKPTDPENPEAKWVSIDEAIKILTHQKDKAFLRKVKKDIQTSVK